MHPHSFLNSFKFSEFSNANLEPDFPVKSKGNGPKICLGRSPPLLRCFLGLPKGLRVSQPLSASLSLAQPLPAFAPLCVSQPRSEPSETVSGLKRQHLGRSLLSASLNISPSFLASLTVSQSLSLASSLCSEQRASRSCYNRFLAKTYTRCTKVPRSYMD